MEQEQNLCRKPSLACSAVNYLREKKLWFMFVGAFCGEKLPSDQQIPVTDLLETAARFQASLVIIGELAILVRSAEFGALNQFLTSENIAFGYKRDSDIRLVTFCCCNGLRDQTEREITVGISVLRFSR